MKKLLGICIVLALPVAAAGCFIVSNPPPEEPAPATTAQPAATPAPAPAEPAPTAEEPKRTFGVPNLTGADDKEKKEETAQ